MLSSFQWLVALRYLRMEVARTAKIHWVTAILGGALLVAVAVSAFIDHSGAAWALDFRIAHPTVLRIAKIGLIAGFVLVEVFILLVRRLTIFTTISTYGLFLGSGALVIVLSVMSGFESDLRHKILGTNAHIVVTTPDRAFDDYEAVRKNLAALPDVVGVTPYISNEVMIASQTNLSGTILKGIDPATVGQVTDLQRNLDVGDLEYLADPDKLRDADTSIPRERVEVFEGAADGGADLVVRHPALKAPPLIKRKSLPGVIIGRELAKTLRLYLGDDVNLVSPLGGIGPSGPIPKSKPFRVAGIFFSGMFEYDSKYAYLSIPAAQKFLGQDDEVTGLELKVKDPERTEPTLKAIRATLGAGYEAQDWKELNRNLFSALKLEKIAMFIVLCFIILVAAFSIIANGIMLVVEKGREIAILKSMGASDQSILVVFLILGLYMGLLGTMAGIAFGVLACLALSHFGLSLDPDVYYITQLPVRMNPYEIVAVFGAAIFIALLATLYPAWIAARLRPVEGLREGNH
ncbi:MAG TPA: ABC transporter permease [Polyangia bacterium]|nr:ABC transporter permease [Polyangia bacterium]